MATPKDNTSAKRAANRLRRATMSDLSLTSRNSPKTDPDGKGTHVRRMKSSSQPSAVLNNVLHSSDFVEESCFECLTKKRDVVAPDTCSRCKNHFCRSCFKSHIDKSCSRENSRQGNRGSPGSCQIKCEIHQSLIDAYCIFHDLPCCAGCARDHHGDEDCDVVPLESYMDNLGTSEGDLALMKKTTYSRLNDGIKSVAGTLKNIKKSKSEMLASEQRTQDAIEEFTREIVDKIIKDRDRLIQDLRENVRQMVRELTEAERDCKTAIGDITMDMQTLGQPKKSMQSAANEFVTMKLIDNKIKEQTYLSTCLRDDTYSTVEYLDFSKNQHLVKMVNGKYNIGDIIVRSVEEDEDHGEEKCVEEISTTRFKYVMSSWLAGDQMTTTCTSAIVAVDDVTVLLADHDNSRLKLFKIGSNVLEPLHFLSLTHAPHGMCPTGNGSKQFFVTFPSSQTVQKFTVSNSRVRRNKWELFLGVECIGIVRVHDVLVVSGYAGDECQLLSADLVTGRTSVLYEQPSDPNHSFTLSRPDYLYKSPDETILFISDADCGIYGINTSDFATVIFHVNDLTLRCPLGLTVDSTGRVYICGNQSYTVHRLSIEGQTLKEVEGRDTFQSRGPQSVVYLERSKELLVTFDNSYDIHLLPVE